MKCMHCGAEVEKHTFCMYCGKRLSEQHVTAKPVRAASGVMRFRQRACVSESSLPEVQKHQPSAARMELDSLRRISSENACIGRRGMQSDAAVLSRAAERPGAEASQSDPSMRQSRELEALLQKLNAPENNFEPADDLNLGSEENFPSSEVDLGSPLISQGSLHDSFFIEDESDAAISGPMPTGSGSFARTPSGGFHPVIDTVKSALRKTIDSTKRVAREIRSGDISKRKVIGVSAICLCAVGAIGILASTLGGEPGGETTSQQPEIASRNAVAGNDSFAIIPIEDSSEPADELNDEAIAQMYDFDDDAFAIPDLPDTGPGDAARTAEGVKSGSPSEIAKNDAKSADAAAAQEKARSAIAQNAGTVPAKTPTEKRLYGRKDNVFAGTPAPRTVKTKRSCIMREGPASRFGIVKEVATGASIKVVAMTEEDWVLEKGGLWAKNGMVKLGPGTQFADAVKGMSLPQPKSRVISSDNWRYIQYGDVFGYVGPACFK